MTKAAAGSPFLVRTGALPPSQGGGAVLSGPNRGCNSMVEQQPSKLNTRVRFPSPAPAFAREAREGCRAEAPESAFTRVWDRLWGRRRARGRELRLGKPTVDRHPETPCAATRLE